MKQTFIPSTGGWMEEGKIGGIGFIAGRWPLDTEKATIVFIHGSGSRAGSWKAQVLGLSDRVNTLALDLPGHGKSGTHGKNSVEEYARAVAGFIETASIPCPIPCGVSLGGAVVLQLLLDFSKQFKAGILIGTGARLKVLPVIFALIDNDYAGLLEMLSEFAVSGKTVPEVIRAYRDDLQKCDPRVTYGDFQACNQFDVIELLGEINVPVLVVSAQDDKLTPPKYAEFLESAIPDASRTHIMDAGHLAPMEKPQEVNQAIIEFLDRHGL